MCRRFGSGGKGDSEKEDDSVEIIAGPVADPIEDENPLEIY